MAAVVAVGVLVALGRLLLALTDSDEGPRRVSSSADSLSVRDAISRQIPRSVPVTGFAFVDEDGSLRLCDGREPGSPPQCIGPWLDVTGIDPGRLNLRRSDPPTGVSWSRGPVVLAGVVQPGRLLAEEIVS